MKNWSVVVLLSLLGLMMTNCSVYAASRPNIILIFADDLGYGDLSSFGHPTLQTPNIDRMAAEGVKLTSFYAQPSCTPARVALLTGRMPMRSGLTRVIFPEENLALPASEITLAESLKESGYRTAIIGKWHLGHQGPQDWPLAHGFEEYFGLLYSNDMKPPFVPSQVPLQLYRNDTPVEHPVNQDTLTERYSNEAVKWIREWKDVPFFIYLAHTMPHQPVHASEQFRGTSPRGLYGDSVSTIDAGVGEILTALKEEGIENNTLVVFTSDNGPWLFMKQYGGSAGSLRGGKGTTYEGGIRVPFVARWPGHIPAGGFSSGISSVMDLFTTFLILAGADVPSDRIVDGKNILPMLKGEGESPHRDFFYYSHDKLEAVRKDGWKLRVTGTPEATLIELFNLDSDPSEMYNLADDFPEKVENLTALLTAERQEMVPGPVYQKNIESLEMLRALYVERGGWNVGPPDPEVLFK